MSLTTNEVAISVGVDRATLLRWMRAGVVKAPKITIRNNRAIRLWNSKDVKAVAAHKLLSYRKGRGRKKNRTNH